MKKVFIRGNEERGSEVIKMLEDLGGVNRLCLKGTREILLYYINKDNRIDGASLKSNIGILIPECFEELHLPEPNKELPNTWEEWVIQNPPQGIEYCVNAAFTATICSDSLQHKGYEIKDNISEEKEDAEAIFALIKLKRLRDTYRQGWVPDWAIYDAKHCIERFKGNFKATISYHMDCFLAFQSEETRDKFYENFKDLIEQTKEFI